MHLIWRYIGCLQNHPFGIKRLNMKHPLNIMLKIVKKWIQKSELTIYRVFSFATSFQTKNSHFRLFPIFPSNLYSSDVHPFWPCLISVADFSLFFFLSFSSSLTHPYKTTLTHTYTQTHTHTHTGTYTHIHTHTHTHTHTLTLCLDRSLFLFMSLFLTVSHIEIHTPMSFSISFSFSF